MGPEVIAYPFLFLALFFESFLLVTLLSKPARVARARLPDHQTPSVAIIVPCWNEKETISDTCESLLALEYPKEKLELILVNDGSTDTTAEVLTRFAHHPNVRIIHKENGGKHTALNAGLAATSAELIGCLDADSFVESDALREIVSFFKEPNVAAVTAAMSIHKPRSVLQHMQSAEYFFSIVFRHAIASINGLYVTPGPFSFYRKEVLEQLGGFRHGHQTEDLEMALRIQKAGYYIENAPHARVYTKSPDTLRALIKQRTRWTTGFLRNVLWEYRGLIANQKYGALGMLVLPSSLLSIGGTILLFFLMLLQVSQSAVAAVSIRTGVPLSYALTPHGTLDWFYIPLNAYLLLGLLALGVSCVLIIIGKRISRTPGTLFAGIVSYAFLYGLIVPLWLLRTTSDLARGKQRAWRH